MIIITISLNGDCNTGEECHLIFWMQIIELAGILSARWYVARKYERIIANCMGVASFLDFVVIFGDCYSFFGGKNRCEGGIVFSEVE